MVYLILVSHSNYNLRRETLSKYYIPPFLGVATLCSPPEDLAYLVITLICAVVISAREYIIYDSLSLHIIVLLRARSTI